MGYWGEAGTPVTWSNPQQVPESQRQSGGWYYNPATNRVDRWWTGDQPQAQSSGGGGGGGGGGGITVQQPASPPRLTTDEIKTAVSGIADVGKQARDFVAQQVADIYKGYQDVVGKFKPIGEVATTIGQELGYPELRQVAQDLSSSLAKIPGVATQTLAGQNINANQLGRIIQARQNQFAPKVQEAVTQFQQAGEQLNQRLQYELQDRQDMLEPIKAKAAAINSSIAAQISTYTTQMQGQLDILAEKIKQEGTLTTAEWDTFRTLAAKELDYKTEMAKLNNATQVETIGGRKYLINSATGTKIADLGPSTAGASTRPSANSLWEQSVGITPSGGGGSTGDMFSEPFNQDFMWTG